MPRTVDGVHDHFHQTTEDYTVEKNGVVSKNSRRRAQCLNQECPFNQVHRNVQQLQTHLRRQRLVPVAIAGAGLSALKCASIIKVSWRIRRPRVKEPPRCQHVLHQKRHLRVARGQERGRPRRRAQRRRLPRSSPHRDEPPALNSNPQVAVVVNQRTSQAFDASPSCTSAILTQAPE